ncbi:hypothetical protein V8G54_003446, partial [Vigna mungo]
YHLPFYLILLPCSECPLDRKQKKKKKKNTVTISDGCGGKMGYKEKCCKLLRVIDMDTGINARVTKRAIVNGGPTHCAQTQMSTWQQQHYRFSYPTLVAHPSSSHKAIVLLYVSANFILLHLLRAAVIASATRLGGGDRAVIAVLLTDVSQHLFQIVPEGVRGGLIVLRQLPPNLILYAETLHPFLKHPIELPQALNLLVFFFEFLRHGLLYGLHQHS